MGYDRGRGVALIAGDPDGNLIGGQDLQGGNLTGFGEGMGILPQEQGTPDAPGLAIVAQIAWVTARMWASLKLL